MLSQKEAVAFSWELLTEVYKLPKDRLYVTYFEGDPSNALEPDLEAKQLWLDQGVPESHVLPGSAKDNFWGKVLLLGVFCNSDSPYRDGSNRPMWPLLVSVNIIFSYFEFQL